MKKVSLWVVSVFFFSSAALAADSSAIFNILKKAKGMTKVHIERTKDSKYLSFADSVAKGRGCEFTNSDNPETAMEILEKEDKEIAEVVKTLDKWNVVGELESKTPAKDLPQCDIAEVRVITNDGYTAYLTFAHTDTTPSFLN